MLYDPRWTESPKTKVETRFVRWLAAQPKAKTYDYTNIFNCGYAQYLRSYGCFAVVNPVFWIGLWLGFVPVAWRVPPGVNDILNAGSGYNFGDALRRARAAMAQCPQDTKND